jgi:multidrug transporter EmrE-like cation transporter
VDKFSLPIMAWLVFVGAAVLEVGGDAAVRRGLRSPSWPFAVAGCLMLAGYGLLINLVRWDFSKLLGVYVAVFAVLSVLCGRFVFREDVPIATWAGLALIVLGGLVIQFGSR